MLGINMHDLVRDAIQTVNPDVDGAVYVSTGATTWRGVRTPTFAQLPTQRLQVQAMSHTELYHLNGLNYAGGMSKLYAYGNLSGVLRPTGNGGDLVRLGDEWWAIQHVLEWWPGWCCVAITRQVDAATLDALLAALATGAVPPGSLPPPSPAPDPEGPTP